jgi:hypothetical protein
MLSQEKPAAFAELGKAKIDNCGANVTLFLLSWFNVPIEFTHLEGGLEVGSHWEQATSLEKIKNVLVEGGLRVDAFKEARLDELPPKVHAEQLCLMHVQRGSPPAGHFYLLVATNATAVLVVDAGHGEKWLPIQEFKQRFDTQFTGYCLFVSRPGMDTNSPSAKTPRANQVAHQ